MNTTTFINYSFLKCIPILAFLVLSSTLLTAQVSMNVDRNTAIYEVGEVIEFNVSGSGQASYVILTDTRNEPLYRGVINLTGNNNTITYQPDQPGVYSCQVYLNGQSVMRSAAVAPLEIERKYPAPSDLMSFWNTQRSQLAAVPIDANVTFIEEDQYSTVYKFDLAMVDNRRVYGLMAIPKGNFDTYPAIIEFPPYGDAANIVGTQTVKLFSEKGGAIGLAITIHNAPLDQMDPNAYQPDDITNREELYYRWAILACLRTIDFVATRPEFDGQNVGVTGVSQGGGLAMIVAGLDERINCLAYSNPAMCVNYGKAYDVASGFPYYLSSVEALGGDNEANSALVLEATGYYDAVHFSAMYDGPSWGMVAYPDTVCPANTVFTAHNLLRGRKILNQYKNGSHGTADGYWDKRLAFFRSVYPAMQNPPWPYTNAEEVGLVVDAGENQTVNVGTSIDLSASVTVDGVANTAYAVAWSVEEGEGAVNFSTFNNRSTEVIFANPGTYVLKFTVYNEEDLDDSVNAHLTTAIDYITITVQ